MARAGEIWLMPARDRTDNYFPAPAPLKARA